MAYEIPKEIDGVQVVCLSPGRVLKYRGEEFVTLVPDNDDNEDMRIWEFSLSTGRIIKTQ